MPQQRSDAGGIASTSLAEDIANAPGALASPEVFARLRAMEHQFRHDNTITPLAPVSGESVEITATSGAGIRLHRASLFYTTDGSLPGLHAAEVPMVAAEVTWDVRTGYLSHWRGHLPGQTAGTVVRYRIAGWTNEGVPRARPDVWAQDGQGFWYRFEAERGITTFAYAVAIPQPVMPTWMDSAVIYHVFLDRFHPGTEDVQFPGSDHALAQHGGTLAGVRISLPYIASLGVNCLWLSPLHPAETYHRYDTMDFFGVDPLLGSDADLRGLVEDAHALGIRVLLDWVPSHCSWHHPAFLAAQKDRNASTASWFTFDEWPDDYRSFLQVSRYLPSLDTFDPGARAHLLESAVYWIKEFGIDGFRLDHAIAPSMDFWVALRQAIEGASMEAVTIGEATDTPDSLRRYRGKLHGVLDFELCAAMRLCFGRGSWSLATMESLIGSYERFMTDGPGRVSFLDNHDMDRFLWVAGNDVARLKMAALCQFTLSATPVIYYGTEIGMTQEAGKEQLGFGGDAEARRNMVWDESRWDHDLLAFYRQLTFIRTNRPWLAGADRQTIYLSEQQNVWAYLRRCADERLLVVLNLGTTAAEIPLPGEWASRHWQLLVSTGDESSPVRGGIVVAPGTGVILTS